MNQLAGVRVLDLGIITAGAATSALLADLGAEVIKIESPSYRDPFRDWPLGEPVDPAGHDTPPFYRATNRNKASLSLDLKTVAGHDAFIRLVTRSDVVVENFRRGVLGKLGLSYDVIRRANPNIILASISSQGETGPDSQFVSFGSTLEAMGGLAWRTGYAGGAPVISGNDLNFPDQVAAIFAAGMICAALRSVRNGGGGAHLDLSQRELTSFLSGDAFAGLPTGQVGERCGNDDAFHVLQDCFAARDRTWVALSVRQFDVGVLALCIGVDATVLEDPGRMREAVRGWMRSHAQDVAVERLLAAGLAAAPVLDGPQVLQRAGQGWEFAMARLADGALVKGFPFQLDRDPLAVAGGAAHCGADSVDVLREVGGYSLEEVRAMIRQGVTESQEIL